MRQATYEELAKRNQLEPWLLWQSYDRPWLYLHEGSVTMDYLIKKVIRSGRSERVKMPNGQIVVISRRNHHIAGVA